MTDRQQVMAAVQLLNLDWLESDSWYGGLTGNLYTPRGLVFNATGCHSLSVDTTDRPAGWRELAADIALGVSPCPNQAICDTCEDR